MLPIDLARSDRELVQEITMHCAGFGSAVSVKTHRTPVPIALVEMATHEQTLELAAEYSGSVFGICVLIHLEQGG